MLKAASILNDFAHLFFPHVCAGCGSDELPSSAVICLQCAADLPLSNFHLHADNPVEKNFWGRMPVSAAMSLFHFGAGTLVQQLLHRLKYRGDRALGRFLGSMMGNALAVSGRFEEIDLLMPVPLFASRLRKRGYNQSLLLCNGIGSVLPVPVNDTALSRVEATSTQTRKKRLERWANMEGRFAVNNPASVLGKHVLLVDDVVTTGATLEACGQALQLAGCSGISIATLAYTD